MNQSSMEQWKIGPSSSQSLSPGHGRGILCLSLQQNLLATGSQDHGIRLYDLKSQKHLRQLYSKRYGHSEWVTQVSFLPDGKLLSAGMDNQLCLWDSSGVRCDTFKAHEGSISKMQTDDNFVAVTAGYDHQLLIWDLRNKALIDSINIHTQPITEFEWKNSLIATGDRSGNVAFSDINTGELIFKKQMHKGPVSAISIFSDHANSNLVLSAGLQDGRLCGIDMRSHTTVLNQKMHNGIHCLKSNLSSFVMVGGADKSVSIVDVFNDCKLFGSLKATNNVLAMEVLNNLVITGNADGNVQTFDSDTQGNLLKLECLYAFGAMQKGAVIDLKVTQNQDKLIIVGDDESPMLLNF